MHIIISVQITKDFTYNTLQGHITFGAVSSMHSSISSSDILGIAVITDRLLSSGVSGTMCLLNVPFCWTLSVSIPDKTSHKSRVIGLLEDSLNVSQLCIPVQKKLVSITPIMQNLRNNLTKGLSFGKQNLQIGHLGELKSPD